MTAMLNVISDAILDKFVPKARAKAACGGTCGCRKDPADNTVVCWIRAFPGHPCHPTQWAC